MRLFSVCSSNELDDGVDGGGDHPLFREVVLWRNPPCVPPVTLIARVPWTPLINEVHPG